MIITDVETIMLRLPEVQPNGDGLQDVLIIRVHTDEGIVGIGEAHTVPLVLKAIIDAPISQLTGQGLRQMLIGRNPLDIQALWSLMYDQTSTYGRRGAVIHAISGIDIALWDILGKVRGQPIHQLLGGARRKQLTAYASDLTHATLEETIATAQRHRDAGYTAVKFGWGGLGRDVRRDAEWVASIRDAVGSETGLMVDVGMPIPLENAIWLGTALSEIGVSFLEEPLSPDDLDGFAELTAVSPTPIATGEKETTRHGFRDLMERGRLRIVQPDVARCGGITETMRICAMAEERNVSVVPHCWATDVLVAATSHVLATQKDAPYLEMNATDNPLRTSLLVDPIRQIGGQVQVPVGPGLGIELNEETIQRFRWVP